MERDSWEKGDTVVRINGKIIEREIAEDFASSFKSIHDSAQSPQAHVLNDRFHKMYTEYHASHCYESINPYLLSWNEMLSVMSHLKGGKASASSIQAEHLMYGSTRLVIHLHLLFNAMIQHGYICTNLFP